MRVDDESTRLGGEVTHVAGHVGRGEVLRTGDDLLLVGFGPIVQRLLQVADVLEAADDLAFGARPVVDRQLDQHAVLESPGLEADVARLNRRAAQVAREAREELLLLEGEERPDVIVAVDRDVDGLAFRDVLTATRAWTDNAHNVVPDRFTLNVNYRFAPDRSIERAESELRGMIDRMAGTPVDVDVVDRAPPAPPKRSHPYVQALIAAADGRVTAKQAWTDVARLAAVGVPALNYGPGLTSQAHQAGEHVPVGNLHHARAVLGQFLRTKLSRREEVGPNGAQ